MTIKIKLLISSILAAAVVILLGGLLVITSARIKQSNHNEARATQIVQTVSEIRFVTFEYLLHKNERSYEQWQMKHADLANLIKAEPHESSSALQLLNSIAADSHDVGVVFTKLASLQIPTKQTIPISEPNKAMLEERLATQLLIKQQSQISAAVKLADSARRETVELGRRVDILIGATVAMILFMGVFNFVFITRTINEALASLLKGAARLAKGDFASRLRVGSARTEFGRLAAAFNSMAASLQETDKIRSEFILIASHQLRTPLTSLKWYTEALLSSEEPLTTAMKKEYIRETHASNERMIALVDQLLVASKIGFGSLETSPQLVQLGPILDGVLHDLSAQLQGKSIELKKTVEPKLPMAWIDPTWMQLIFQNLLSNAVKYSQPGKNVSISLAHKSNSVLITVADRGCGIPENQKNKIFTRLFRADNAREMEGEGSGLGLYIAKAVIEGAGGTIWFESTENKGTTFFVSLRTTALAKHAVPTKKTAS